MADKSCYAGAGGYGSGFMGGASSSNYAREEYAWTREDFGTAKTNQTPAVSGTASAAAPANNPPGVFKPRTDQSCYLGPN